MESDWIHVSNSGAELLDDPEALGLLDEPPDEDDMTLPETVSHEALDLHVYDAQNLEQDIDMWPSYNQLVDCIQQCADLSIAECHPNERSFSSCQVQYSAQAHLHEDIIKSLSDPCANCVALKGDYSDYALCIEDIDTGDELESQHECAPIEAEATFEDGEYEDMVTMENGLEDLKCAQCDDCLPDGVDTAEDGHRYCDRCWRHWCSLEDSEESDDEEVYEWLRNWRARREASSDPEFSLRPVLITGPSLCMPPTPVLPEPPMSQPLDCRRIPLRTPALTSILACSTEPALPSKRLCSEATETHSPSFSSSWLQPIHDEEPISMDICTKRLPDLHLPTVQLPQLVLRTSKETSSLALHQESCTQCEVGVPQLPRITMAEPTLLEQRFPELPSNPSYIPGELGLAQTVGDNCVQFPAISPRSTTASDQAVQVGEEAIPVRFLYSSPLLIGNKSLALNVRADLESLCAAEGIRAEVRVATVECLREALLARTGPEILHISAHCMSLAGVLSLVLEDAGSAAHPIPVCDLCSVGPWDGLGLLVLLACNSELLVQSLLKNGGLRRAICCSAAVLDRAAHLFCKTLYQALGAGHDLLRSFDVAKAAVRSSPDPCLRAEAGKFRLLGDLIADPSGQGWSPMPSIVMEQGQVIWPTWPRVEDYVGRESLSLQLASVFAQRRAICLWGDGGSGKTALCTEFCRHFSAPGGRRFSARVILIDYVRALRENPKHPDVALCSTILSELRLRGLVTISNAQDAYSGMPSQQYSSLLRMARELDEGGPWLLVIDGLKQGVHADQHCADNAEADDTLRDACQSSSIAVHSLLADLLQVSAQLCILLAARSPPRGPWSSLGPSKVVEVQLPSLAPEDTARLLARRASRPFFYRDFKRMDGNALSGMPLRLDQELISLISKSPLGQLLGGNPGRIIRAAADVHAELPSLLGHPWLKTLPDLVARAIVP
jgi:hypothetical protein